MAGKQQSAPPTIRYQPVAHPTVTGTLSGTFHVPENANTKRIIAVNQLNGFVPVGTMKIGDGT